MILGMRGLDVAVASEKKKWKWWARLIIRNLNKQNKGGNSLKQMGGSFLTL